MAPLRFHWNVSHSLLLSEVPHRRGGGIRNPASRIPNRRAGFWSRCRSTWPCVGASSTRPVPVGRLEVAATHREVRLHGLGRYRLGDSKSLQLIAKSVFTDWTMN